MRVHINGELRDVPEGISLQTLLEHLSLSQQRVAVELDRQIVRRADWTATNINEDAKIEIVHFVGGG
jgi:thiamine biosynthesis protein ThiS